MRAHLAAWAATLSIITSLIIIEGAWMVQAFVEWPRRATLGAPRRAVPQPQVNTAPPPSSAEVKPSIDAELLREYTFAASDKCKVPARILFRQVRAESGFRPWVVSSSGAVGLMQIKPYHAYWPLDLWDAETNLNLGACLLRRHFERMGTWELALHAYHGGQYRTETGPETRAYARGILANTNVEPRRERE